jgi:S1-C subfamily serine protease
VVEPNETKVPKMSQYDPTPNHPSDPGGAGDSPWTRTDAGQSDWTIDPNQSAWSPTGPYVWSARPAPAPGPAPKRSRILRSVLGGTLALALLGGGVGIGIAVSDGSTTSGTGTVAAANQDSSGNSASSNRGRFSGGSSGTSTDGGTGSSSSMTSATTTQQVGVVDIDTVLSYQSAEAAGTGLVLTSSGEILTNNHVVYGATSINVTVVSTGKTYTATVVGTDATDDVAVLQLQDASGLATAKRSTSATVAVGDSVVAVGNAGGTGGTPSAATGTVTALDQSITATDSDGSNAETLNNLIETNADVVAGDSGGPLYNAAGQVIGIDTAGSSATAYPVAAESYAIPIANALSVATKIEAGQASATIHIGESPFLGVEVASTTGRNRGGDSSTTGVIITGVLSGGPASAVGLVAGDIITSINGQAITTSASLTTALNAYHPGDSVTLVWTDASGQTQRAQVTLVTGPAQ